MTVRELIEELQKVEDKDIQIIVKDERGYWCPIDKPLQTEKYFTCLEDGKWVGRTRKCIIISD